MRVCGDTSCDDYKVRERKSNKPSRIYLFTVRFNSASHFRIFLPFSKILTVSLHSEIIRDGLRVKYMSSFYLEESMGLSGVLINSVNICFPPSFSVIEIVHKN